MSTPPSGQPSGDPAPPSPYGPPPPFAAPPPQDWPTPYGPQPQYGPPPQYGPAPGYPPGPTPASASAYGSPYATPVHAAYAHWGQRVGASLLDAAFTLPALVLIGIGLAVSGAAGYDPQTAASSEPNAVGLVVVLLGYAAAIGLQIYNRCILAGRTGQSWGRRIVGIHLLGEQTGRPIGGGLAFGRELAHILDGFFYIGYLWPLWDGKRQTFADKVCGTVVTTRR